LIDQESELDQIYAAPLEGFVKLRNELAGRLRKEGDDATATRIAALKKPSVSAWVVNQLAKAAELDLHRLIKAGETMEQAQRDAISGEKSGGFADARREEAAAITRLRTAAQNVLPSAAAATLDRIANTLRAGSATSEGRKLIKQGRLTEDLEPPGFDAFSGLGDPVPAKKNTDGKAENSKASAKIETLRRRKREADENAKTLTTEAEDLEQEARAAEEVAKRASKAAANARKRADEALAQLQRIEAELTGLEQGP